MQYVYFRAHVPGNVEIFLIRARAKASIALYHCIPIWCIDVRIYLRGFVALCEEKNGVGVKLSGCLFHHTSPKGLRVVDGVSLGVVVKIGIHIDSLRQTLLDPLGPR